MHLTNEIWSIFGRKGSGKTTLARLLTVFMKRSIILDSMGHDFGGGCVVRDAQSLQDYYNGVRFRPRFCIIVRPTDDATREAFFRLARQTRNTWIVIDEIDLYMSPHNINPCVKWILDYGRHYGISLMGISRRPHAVHRNLTALSDVIVALHTHEPRDLKYLSEYMRIDGINRFRPLQYRVYGHSPLLEYLRRC